MKILLIIVTLMNLTKAKGPSFLASSSDFLLQDKFMAIKTDNHKDDALINFLKRPNPSTTEGKQSLRRSSVKYLVDVYNSLKDEEDDVYDDEIAETKRRYTRSAGEHIDKYNNIVTFSSKTYHHNITGFKGISMRFNLTGIAFDYFLTKAEIHLFQTAILSKLSQSHKKFTVAVWDVKSPGVTRMQMSKGILSSFDGWMQLDVTATLAKALKQRKTEKEFLISVHCEGNVVDPMDFGILGVNSLEEYQPFLIGFFDGPDSGIFPQVMMFERQKRSANYLREFKEFEPSQQACSRMNFTIHVKEIDMDEIVLAPKTFDAYYCSGECNFPLQAQMNATNHALIQTLAHLKNPSIPKPKCTPRTLGSIRVLEYLNDGSTILKPYRNTVVKSCGCQ